VDVVSASAGDDTIAWYVNDGVDVVSKNVVSTLAVEALGVYAIDVDGDGDVDVLSASANDDTVAWYENDGSQSVTGVVAIFFLHHSGSTGRSRSASSRRWP
jgi:hypothetical protein